MVQFFQIVQIASGALLVLLILMHAPKGEGLAAIGGASQLFSSQKSVESGLNKVTTVIAAIFVVVSLLLGFNIIHS